MRFTANIPGIGDISVDGNFATEDTLNRLVSIMAATKSADNSKQKRANDQLADFSDTVDNSNRSLDEFSDELNRSEAVHSKVTDGLGRMAN
jgi:septal ring factor EnvC (AmiA/AmiB activator)